MRQGDFFARIAELLGEGRSFAAARLLATEGSVPQETGAGILIFPDGATEFTIGGGPFEAAVIKDALGLLEGGTLLHKTYEITRASLGMYCCGRAEVLIEAFPQPWELWVFGGGHVGQALVDLASRLGLFRITLIDDRAEFASRQRHPHADRVVLTDRDYREGVGVPGITTCVVIVTRCHETDRTLAARFVGTPSRYVGMIGSETKRRTIVRELVDEGVPASALQKLETPAGLPIGGKSPGEVALSILARVVQAKNSASPDRHFDTVAGAVEEA
ncbi:MAG: XdhC family protein [Acidobacteria bacterium]|nr:XdhC family protein [Acidobacteriota bacterium]